MKQHSERLLGNVQSLSVDEGWRNKEELLSPAQTVHCGNISEMRPYFCQFKSDRGIE